MLFPLFEKMVIVMAMVYTI